MDNRGRFYDIMGCYLYDYRLAAFAIVELGRRKFSPKNIYIDLLNLKVDKWVTILETIAENIKHTELREWCNRKQTTLNSLEIDFWRNDDMTIIEDNFTDIQERVWGNTEKPKNTWKKNIHLR